MELDVQGQGLDFVCFGLLSLQLPGLALTTQKTSLVAIPASCVSVKETSQFAPPLVKPLDVLANFTLHSGASCSMGHERGVIQIALGISLSVPLTLKGLELKCLLTNSPPLTSPKDRVVVGPHPNFGQTVLDFHYGL